MPVSGKSPRPNIQAQMGFDLLMELYDKGRGLDAKAKVEVINKFLAISDPGIEKKIQWGWFYKGDRADQIVDAVRGGLEELRDGNPFMRPAPPGFVVLFSSPEEIESFRDGIVWDQSHSRVIRVGSRDPRHLFLTRVFELLTEVAPWLRVCKREDCQKFFLFQRPKQIYCSDVCAQRVRMERFLTQRGSKMRRK